MNEPQPAFVLPRPEMHSASWLRDAVHCPRALPHLVGDIVTEWFGQVVGRPVAVVNGYLFMSLGTTGPAASFAVAPQADPAEAWYDFYVPRVETVARWVAERDWDNMDTAAIVAALPDVTSALASAFASTMAPLAALGAASANLIAFCARYFEEGETTAAALMSGYHNATAAIGAEIQELARSAAGDPPTAAAVRGGDVEALRSGRPEWWTSFERFLERYGRGNETWFEFHRPTWREAPAAALALVARALGGELAASGHERAAAEREALVGRLKAALPGDPERRQLDDLLAATASYVGVIEDRARLQLVLAAAPRFPIGAIGRRLAGEGAIEEPDDVYFLALGELSRVPGGWRPGPGLIARRRAEHAAWDRLEPPGHLGLELPPGLGRVAMLRLQFGLGGPDQTGDGVVRGFAASPGAMTGTARIIEGVDDADRLQPGDVLVCRNTAPPWTPLFAIAGAVVVEAGGVLSHAAIAAREYAIPAVVGAKGATRLIPDGALVTVDGEAGTVTLA